MITIQSTFTSISLQKDESNSVEDARKMKGKETKQPHRIHCTAKYMQM